MNKTSIIPLALMAALGVVSLPVRSWAAPVAPESIFYTASGGQIFEYDMTNSTDFLLATDTGSTPLGLAPNPAGGLYVADANGYVEQLSTTAVLTTNTYVQNAVPYELAVSPINGDVYVTYNSSTNITQYLSTGAGVTAAWGHVPSGSQYGIAFNSSGQLYVSIPSPGSIYSLSSGGVPTLLATGFGRTYGLAVDSSGNLYTVVSGSGTNEILKVTSGGAESVYYSGSLVNGGFGLAIDSANNLFVSNEGNGTITEIYAGGGSGTTLVTGVSGINSLTIGSPIVVPEPSTWAFLVTGAAGVLAFRRRNA